MPALHPAIASVTQRIIERSRPTREAYLARCAQAGEAGPRRAHLSCGNQAHAYAAMTEKDSLAAERRPHLGIISAYNDILSAHQPYENYPALIRKIAQENGATAQMAAGVPAMCDGVTQGRAGMELSLFSRDVIAMSAGIGLSHDVFDAAVYLGICDKIVPGLIMAAATFGHLPAVFIPSGPMPSGLPNDEKARIREAFAKGDVDRAELMRAEMASYHGPGTCTFYGTANTNQMLMEVMGLQLPGSSFVNPNTALRSALTEYAITRAAQITALGENYIPVSKILDEKTFVNGIVGLMATGGSTNLVLHLPAMAKAAGIILDIGDFGAISDVVPLMSRVYPNGLADVNHFHAAGGIGFLIRELTKTGYLHDDVFTILGQGLGRYTREPGLDEDDRLIWREGSGTSLNEAVLRPSAEPFQDHGGLKPLTGNLGRGVIKTSALADDRLLIEAPVRIFTDQDSVKTAFKSGELEQDTVIVVRFQGPKANGMPELHALTPLLGILQGRGFRVALVTDGRMSGASGKVPAAIHISPEAADGGPLARLQDGDIVRLDAVNGVLECLTPDWQLREPAIHDATTSSHGMGRELFAAFRAAVGPASEGCTVAI